MVSARHNSADPNTHSFRTSIADTTPQLKRLARRRKPSQPQSGANEGSRRRHPRRRSPFILPTRGFTVSPAWYNTSLFFHSARNSPAFPLPAPFPYTFAPPPQSTTSAMRQFPDAPQPPTDVTPYAPQRTIHEKQPTAAHYARNMTMFHSDENSRRTFSTRQHASFPHTP